MSYDPLQDLGWYTYVFTATIYSIFIFVDKPSSKANLIFTKQNTGHLPSVISIHVAFLGVILGLTRAAAHFYWSLPTWTTTILGGAWSADVSFLTIVFVLIVIAMYFVERKWIFKALEGDGVIKHSGSTSED